MYELQILNQMIEQIDRHSLFYEKIFGYKRGHLIKTILSQFRDNIIQAIKRVELTMAIFADFSKAFNTVDHTRILEKNAQNGFAKARSTLDSKLLAKLIA